MCGSFRLTLLQVGFPAVPGPRPVVEILVSLLAGSLEAHKAKALSRENRLPAFAAMNDSSKFHGLPPELCLLLSAGDSMSRSRRSLPLTAFSLLNRSLLAVSRSGLASR